jgi:hypothetical protein
MSHAQEFCGTTYWRIPLPDTPGTHKALRIGRKACIRAIDAILGTIPRDKQARNAIGVAYTMHAYDRDGCRVLRTLRNDLYWEVEQAREAYSFRFSEIPYWPMPWPEQCAWPEARSRYLYGQPVGEHLREIARAVVAATAPNTEAGKAYLDVLDEMRRLSGKTRQLAIELDPPPFLACEAPG